MATMKTLNGYGFNATEFNGKTSDSYLQLGDNETGSTGAAPTINAGTFGGMTVSQFVNMIYPVGSIYMSASATSPATLFGGTWQQIQDRFLLGAGGNYDVLSYGGEVEHTLTVEEMPVHNHGWATQYTDSSHVVSWPSWEWRASATQSETTPDSVAGHTDSQGGNAAHNNMPPYLAVYMWVRTA